MITIQVKFEFFIRICGPGTDKRAIVPCPAGAQWVDGQNTILKDSQGTILQGLQEGGYVSAPEK